MKSRISFVVLGCMWGGLVAMGRDYSVSWDVASSGGGSSSGGSFAVWDVVGQPDGGGASGGTFAVTAGQMSQPGLAGFSTRIASGGRRLFYNGSGFDKSSSQADSSVADSFDDLAIASDKTALVSGTSALANVSSYVQGITGIMVDVEALPDSVTEADFEIRRGNSSDISSWTSGVAPAVSLRRGAGADGSDRVTLTWPNATFRNCWVEVRMKATPQTGLALDDVFYFGNALADTGNSASDYRVTAADVLGLRVALKLGTVPITSRFDLNRDKLINTTDVLWARLYSGRPGLVNIQP